MTTPVADGRWAALRESVRRPGAALGRNAPPAPAGKGRERASYPHCACQREDPNHGGLIADEGANPYDQLTSNHQPAVASRTDRPAPSTR